MRTSQHGHSTKLAKRLLGWMAVFLGSLGLFACLAGLVGVWVLNHRLQRPVAEVLGQVTAVCVRVGDGADRISDRIQSSRDGVREFDTRVRKRAREQLDLSEEDVEKLEELSRQLRFTIQRVRDWIAFAGTVADFLEHVVDMGRSALVYLRADSEDRPDIVQALAGGREQVEDATHLLAEVEEQLAAIRAHEGLHEDRASRIEALLARVDSALVRLQESATDFSVAALGIGEAASKLAIRVRRGLLISAFTSTLLLLWQ